MTKRKHTPLHDFWHPRVEGQIRDAIHSHPEWFRFKDATERDWLINSLAKRIVGEIAAVSTMAAVRPGVAGNCSCDVASSGGCTTAAGREGGVVRAAPLPNAGRAAP